MYTNTMQHHILLSGNLILTTKRTLKDWFYLEMVSHRAIMFGKKQKSCVKRTHLVTDDGLYHRKAFYTVKIVFYSSSIYKTLTGKHP